MLEALFISVVGMGLVFAAIFLLWGVIAGVVRLSAEKNENEPMPAQELPVGAQDPAEAEAPESSQPEWVGSTQVITLPPESTEGMPEAEWLYLAAAAAVSAALSTQRARQQEAARREIPVVTLPEPAVVSAWQSVMRTNMLNKRGSVR